MIESQAADILAGLAQETRLKVMRMLVRAGPGGLAAGEIAEAVGVSASNLSFHLNTLEAANLVTSQRRQRSIIYCCNFDTLQTLLSYLVEDCCKGMAKLD
jgi:DNA-binding transcriptional ArsR family regulator